MKLPRISFRVAAVAGLALTSVAAAQPASTDLGTLPVGATNVPGIPITAGGVVWYRFTVTNPVQAPFYLDIDTEGSALTTTNDTEIGLFDSTGALVASDDDDGSGFLSQLSFGATTPTRPPVGTGATYNGRDGNLAAGTYYLSISGFNSTFAAGWSVTSTSTYSGTGVLNIVLGQAILGSCCLPNGTCVETTQASCTSQSGTYRGDGTTCATACPQPPNSFSEQGDTGELPGTATVTSGSGALNTINGALSAGSDADMYAIQICDYANFSASMVGGATWDTQLFLFRADGTGVSFNDDASETPIVRQSRIDTTGLTANGTYYLAVSGYDKDPLDSAAQQIWEDQSFYTVRIPDGPGAANPIASWSATGASGTYSISLTGACFAQGGNSCYANCDGSTNTPVLNVADFTCFLQRYAAGCQ